MVRVATKKGPGKAGQRLAPTSSPVRLPPSAFLHTQPSLAENKGFNNCFPSKHLPRLSKPRPQHPGILEDSAALFTDEEADTEREVISSKVKQGMTRTQAFLFPPNLGFFPPLYDDCSNHYHLPQLHINLSTSAISTLRVKEGGGLWRSKALFSCL